jgi:hypothetical protein
MRERVREKVKRKAKKWRIGKKIVFFMKEKGERVCGLKLG